MPPELKAPAPDILLQSREKLVSTYKTRSQNYKNRQSFRNRASEAAKKKYSDDLIISFRSACQAKDNLNTHAISYASIGILHEISKDYCSALRKDFTLRPTCLPDNDLILSFENEFKAGIAESRLIKASRKTNKLNSKNIPAHQSPQQTLTYQAMLLLFKKHYGEFPTCGLDSLLLLQELLANRLVTLEWGEAAITLIFENSFIYDELDPKKTPAEITDKPIKVI